MGDAKSLVCHPASTRTVIAHARRNKCEVRGVTPDSVATECGGSSTSTTFLEDLGKPLEQARFASGRTPVSVGSGGM